MKLKLFCMHISIIISCQIYGQNSATPKTESLADEKKMDIRGYVRGSIYGGGQDGGSTGSKNYDVSTSFVEVSLRADYTTSFGKGYTFFKSETRVREGQYYNGTLYNATGTTDIHRTDVEIRDLYVGYRDKKIEVSFGNQNIQWGRTIGPNPPTNNISPRNLYFLTANRDDTKLYNLMAVANYKILSNLDWQVIAVPIAKSTVFPVKLLNIGQGIVDTNDPKLPDQRLKNGAIATRFNLTKGKSGASLSYFNGYDPNPSITLDYLNPSDTPVPNETTNPFSKEKATGTILYKKQTFGADFAINIKGKITKNIDGTTTGPTNDFTIIGEAAYNNVPNPNNLPHIPQSYLAFSLGAMKIIYSPNKVDRLMIASTWYGKYTPNFIELKKPIFDPANPGAYYQAYLDGLYRDDVRFVLGQKKPLDHSLTSIISQSFAKGRLVVSILYDYSLLNLPKGNPPGHYSLLYPRVSWNINKLLSATAGGLRMWGPSSLLYGPVVGGLFGELKASF